MTEQVAEKTPRKRLSPADKALEAVRAEAARQDKAVEKRDKAQIVLTTAEAEVTAGKARLTYLLQHPDLAAADRASYSEAYLADDSDLQAPVEPRAVVDSPQA